MEHVPLSLSRPPTTHASENGAASTEGVPPVGTESTASNGASVVATTLAPPPTLEESIQQSTTSQIADDNTPISALQRALEAARDPSAQSRDAPPPPPPDSEEDAIAGQQDAQSSRRRSRDPTEDDSTEADHASLRASANRFRQVSASEEDFGGPISIQRDDGLFTTAHNPYVMPDLDILAPYWSTAARAALRGRVTGLMRFFRLAGYIPPAAPTDLNPDDSTRRRMRVSRGYETWKCRACGVLLNPVCGETGNARKHISLKKCGGLFAPLEEALLLDKDEEVRHALIANGARVVDTEVADSSVAQMNGFPSSAGSFAGPSRPITSMDQSAVGKQQAWFAGGTDATPPSGLASGSSGLRQGSASSGGAKLSRPIFQQHPDGSTTLIGWTTPEANNLNSSNGAGPETDNVEPLPPIILSATAGQQQQSSSFEAPSALAVAAYFLSIGQPAEHADSVPWRHLFDGLQGMPTVQEIREALQGGSK